MIPRAGVQRRGVLLRMRVSPAADMQSAAEGLLKLQLPASNGMHDHCFAFIGSAIARPRLVDMCKRLSAPLETMRKQRTAFGRNGPWHPHRVDANFGQPVRNDCVPAPTPDRSR